MERENLIFWQLHKNLAQWSLFGNNWPVFTEMLLLRLLICLLSIIYTIRTRVLGIVDGKIRWIFEPRHEKTCFFFAYAKSKPQISCAVTAQLISAFVFAA